ncbi:hypothetical protein LZC95_34860 [Pendulispora brunnea]|uniref:Uncharacterized protein n=1 Tax=Pendulispora brunnea TaxID=2905690 RepID=A0ABZ2K4B0_9BACT
MNKFLPFAVFVCAVACGASAPDSPQVVGDASTDAGATGVNDAFAEASTQAADIPVHVRTDLAYWSTISASRAGDGLVHLVVAQSSVADYRLPPSYSWVDAESDGRIARDGAFNAAAGASLSPIVTFGDDHDWFMDAPSPRARPTGEGTRPQLLNLSPARPSDAGAMRPLPFLLADGLAGEMDMNVYRARCASKDPVFVYDKLGATAYVRVWHLANGEDVVIATNCGFTRWLKLAADGTRLADATLADFSGVEFTPPSVAFVPFEPMATALDVEADGATTVVLDIQDGWNWSAVLAAMGLPYQEPRTSRKVVIHLDAQGTPEWRAVLTSDASRRCSLVVRSPTAVHVMGRSHRETERPGDTLESDVWIASLDPTTGALSRERVVDIDKEDWPDSAIADPRGGLILALRTGAVQVDSGSIVTYPDVVLMAFDDQLAERDRFRFGSPRADEVSTLSWLDDGRLLVAGSWDGPITHTPDAERHASGFWAALPLDNWGTRTVVPRSW